MSTEGFEAVFVETHNWGKSARFFQALGFEPEFTTDHNSGLFRNGDGPYLFIAEVPPTEPTGVRCVLKVADAQAFSVDGDVEVVQPFTETHYGTQEMLVRDPDGNVWNLQAPGKQP
ncbi:VOC family protein [Nocardia sp. NPDC003482]